MLALRLARGSRPLVQLRRLLVVAASGGMGFLLLTTMTWAMGHPEGSVLRLLWCLVPAAATVQLAVAVARADPAARPRPDLFALGLGPVRLAVLGSATTAVSCCLGSLLALLVFLQLRTGLPALPYAGAAGHLLASGRVLPLAATLLLLAVVPVTASAAAASALALRGRREAQPAQEAAFEDGPPVPAALPWGVALTAVGLAVETYASHGEPGTPLPLPGHFDGSPAGVLTGWVLAAVGLALIGPGVSHLCGRLLQSAHPGPVRLLAGRSLITDAQGLGRPLGVLSAVLSGAFAAAALYRPGDDRPFGPLTALGGVLVVGCAAASLLTAAVGVGQDRSDTTRSLVDMGTPVAALRTATLLRTTVLLAAFVPLTWAVAAMAAAPLGR